MNKRTRKAIAKGFRATIEYLRYPDNESHTVSTFICIAMSHAYHFKSISENIYTRCSDIIIERLGRHPTIEVWLRAHGVTDLRDEQVQEHRKQWLIQLAEEFEE